MKIAITGGTGTLGRQVAAELRERGHNVRALSRGAPEYRVDLTTGAGLDEALDGCEVVVDASNNSSKTAATTLVDGTRRLLAAGRAAGVTHHVCVSIVGCELVPALTTNHPDVRGGVTFADWLDAGKNDSKDNDSKDRAR